MTIELGWWIAPVAVMVCGWMVARRMCKESGSDWFGMDGFFSAVTYVIFFVVPSLIAWLVWALMR